MSAGARLPAMTDDQGRRPATYADLRKVPDHLVAEIVDGELITSPRPAYRHAAVSSGLGADLSVSFGRRGGSGPNRSTRSSWISRTSGRGSPVTPARRRRS